VSILVVKIGGSPLRSPSDYCRIAESIKKLYEGGYKLVVVVSAMKGSTDELLKLSHEVSGGSPDAELLDEVLSFGERLSARLLALALKSRGVPAVILDPADTGTWPIVTTGEHLRAKPILEVTVSRVKEVVPKLLERSVVIVPGFIGVSHSDFKVTTLGRNTSDVTAALIAYALGAEYLVLTKDGEIHVHNVGSSACLEKVPVEYLKVMVNYGSRVVHPATLDYVSSSMKLVVTSPDKLPELKGSYVEIHEKPRVLTYSNLSLLLCIGVLDVGTLLATIVRGARDIVDVILEHESVVTLLKCSPSRELVSEILERGLAKLLRIIENCSLVIVSNLTYSKVCSLLERIRDLLYEGKVYHVSITRFSLKLVTNDTHVRDVLSIVEEVIE